MAIGTWLAANAALISAAGVGIGAVGTGVSALESSAAAAKEKRAADLQQRADNISQNRERRRVLAEGRVRRAQVEQAAVNQGVASSSSAQGGASSATNQSYAGANYLDQVGGLTQQANNLRMSAMGNQSRANTFSGISSIGFRTPGFVNEFKTIFD